MITTLPEPLPLFLKVQEAADLLRADPRTIRRGIEAGDIPGRRFGGVIRIPTQAFFAWAQIQVPDNSEAGDSTSPATAQHSIDTTEEPSPHGAHDTPDRSNNVHALRTR